MPTSWRLVRPFMLIAVLSALIAVALFPLDVNPVAAQDGDDEAPVTIMGTNELEALVIALRDAFAEQNPDAAPVEIDPRGGQNTGFSELCEGNVDIVMSTEPISDTQIQACGNAEQAFVEVVLAYEAVVLLPSPDAALACAAPEAIYDAWAFGAPEEVLWSDLGVQDGGDAISFYGPDPISPAATLFADLIPAGRLREDINVAEDPAALAEAVQNPENNAFAYLTLAQFQDVAADAGLRPLQLQTDAGECVAATTSTLGARTYPLARTDYLYVNADSAEQTSVQSFLQFVLADPAGAATIVPQQGYTLADSGTYEYGLNNVTSGSTGRTFSRPVTPVSLATDTEGTVRIAGTVMLRDLTSELVNTFTNRFMNADIVETTYGDQQGWQSFCTGAAEVLQSTRTPTEEEQALCEENGIDIYALDLGVDAQVIAVPAGNDEWLTCMDGETAAALLRQGTEDDPGLENWSEINADWPDKPILLVVPPRTTGETDFLIYNLIGELGFNVRQDMTEDADPIYRVQGVGNTDNGLTYVWVSAVRDVQADVALLPVQGAGADECVEPTAESFTDRSYPLAYGLHYYVNQSALADNAMLRALMWHLFDEDMLQQYGNLNTVGFDVSTLRLDERDAVYEMLSAYEDDTAADTENAEVEATEAPAEEATAEPTEEPTEEPTVEPTDEPTEEPAADADADAESDSN